MAASAVRRASHSRTYARWVVIWCRSGPVARAGCPPSSEPMSRSRCSATSSRPRLAVGDVRVVTAILQGGSCAAELGATLVDTRRRARAPPSRPARGVDGHCLVVNADLPRVRPADLERARSAGRLGPRARRGARRDDERARAPVRRGLPAALRSRERRAVPGARGRAGAAVRGSDLAEPRRGRRHDRAISSASASARGRRTRALVDAISR